MWNQFLRPWRKSELPARAWTRMARLCCYVGPSPRAQVHTRTNTQTLQPRLQVSTRSWGHAEPTPPQRRKCSWWGACLPPRAPGLICHSAQMTVRPPPQLSLTATGHPAAPAPARSGRGRDGEAQPLLSQGHPHHSPLSRADTSPRDRGPPGLPAGDGAAPVLEGELALLQLHDEPGQVLWGPGGSRAHVSAGRALEGDRLTREGGPKPRQPLAVHSPGASRGLCAVPERRAVEPCALRHLGSRHSHR